MLEIIKRRITENKGEISFWLALLTCLFLLFNGMVASAIFVAICGAVLFKQLQP